MEEQTLKKARRIINKGTGREQAALYVNNLINYSFGEDILPQKEGQMLFDKLHTPRKYELFSNAEHTANQMLIIIMQTQGFLEEILLKQSILQELIGELDAAEKAEQAANIALNEISDLDKRKEVANWIAGSTRFSKCKNRVTDEGFVEIDAGYIEEPKYVLMIERKRRGETLWEEAYWAGYRLGRAYLKYTNYRQAINQKVKNTGLKFDALEKQLQDFDSVLYSSEITKKIKYYGLARLEKAPGAQEMQPRFKQLIEKFNIIPTLDNLEQDKTVTELANKLVKDFEI